MTATTRLLRQTLDEYGKAYAAAQAAHARRAHPGTIRARDAHLRRMEEDVLETARAAYEPDPLSVLPLGVVVLTTAIDPQTATSDDVKAAVAAAASAMV